MYRLKTLNEYLVEDKKLQLKIKKPIPGDSISIFDIDDTLVVTKATIRVFDPSTGEEHEMTPAEYNEYEHMPHHQLDFTDFDDMELLKDGQLIEWVVNILRKTMNKGKAVGIITARSTGKELIGDFLKHHGIKIHPDLIFSVNDSRLSKTFTGSNADKKKKAFKMLIEMGYKKFKFFDDDLKNLEYAKSLEKEHPEIKVVTRHIQPKWRPKLEDAYADRILEKGGPYSEEVKWWALFAHISDHFVKAKNTRELMNKFNEARKKSMKSPKGWPMPAIKYFYDWHLDRIRDKDRVKKAELMAKESANYYETLSGNSHNISE